jgi:hypothetical protein
VKNQDSIAKQTSFLAPYPSALGSFSHMDAYSSSSKNTGKMNLQPILNKTSPHTELGFNMLAVAGKLVKYIVHLFKRKN